ncbi:12052_t:CDS:1 [Ambispora gerdemannii]|uniref:12052_t:CDS:1 n=1 Tax=Ambispora gerdemannii TaxID=144530 RepID=A0A9N9BFZ5_9GLOM|nr:12052_t:CDS:1 [Ambispora gerdemannii]
MNANIFAVLYPIFFTLAFANTEKRSFFQPHPKHESNSNSSSQTNASSTSVNDKTYIPESENVDTSMKNITANYHNKLQSSESEIEETEYNDECYQPCCRRCLTLRWGPQLVRRCLFQCAEKCGIDDGRSEKELRNICLI